MWVVDWLHIFLFFLSCLCSIPLNDYKLLVCDIQQMLVAVTIHSCSSSGSQYFRIIEDLITLLGFMQTSKMRRTQGDDQISIHMRKHIGLVISRALQLWMISSCQAWLRKQIGLSLHYLHLQSGNSFEKYLPFSSPHQMVFSHFSLYLLSEKSPSLLFPISTYFLTIFMIWYHPSVITEALE